MTAIAATPTISPATATTATGRASRRLLTAGLVAGPLYVATVVGQYLLRDGYDPTRHAASVLANGDYGWVQIANFVVAAALTVAAAVGMRRSGVAGTWAPRLVGVFGVSLLAAAAFVADPVEGFPPGTPASAAGTMSWHGFAHLAAGTVGFTCLAIACFALGRRLRRDGRGGAAYSVASGAVVLAGFIAVSASAGASWGVLAFTAGILAGWAWLAVTCARLAR
ncbi:DUF998 domain-containing protein [Jiangella rhizosphaerae]|uniref:DUF998 domain-containing protein n=1 Tax=Jiangella rhizosphaerae TaxID=2293569 RepID=A0A418KU92_9ACTN|nr:DUF998 domain-containing protein [Jiangella rhizosphaerae]RIQ30057.1 DUF998 domain-containing protein [Jiangella rhizosphaerae]